MKDYILDLLCACAPEDGEMQDAIEYALHWHWVDITFKDLEVDEMLIGRKRDEIRRKYRQVLAHEQAVHQSETETNALIEDILGGWKHAVETARKVA